MRAMVTGATGFVGSAVARALLQAQWQVRALVRQESDRRNLQQLAVETVVGNLADSASLERALSSLGAPSSPPMTSRRSRYRCSLTGSCSMPRPATPAATSARW